MEYFMVLLLYLRTSVVHPSPASFLPKEFKSWFWPSSIVVGNWLYLHGGKFHYNDNGVMAYLPNSQTFAIDLTQSWSTSTVEAVISDHAVYRYSLGGTITYDVTEGVPTQMVMEDFVIYDYGTQKFSNVSRTTPHSLAGKAQFVLQYGKEGVVLFLGGKNLVDRGAASLDLADLGSIQVYDVYTNTFYTQAATNAPTGRYSFCSVGASNEETSSYEIFIYGGDVGSSNSAAVATLSKVYILTLPGFNWLEHNQRQMLSIGGDQNPSGVDWSSYVDSWNSAMKIFDLTTLTWSDSYSPDAKAYTRPDIVNKFYSSNSEYPSTWGDAALNSTFNSVAVTSPTTTSTPTPMATPGGDTEDKKM
ncbi:hypothetical protein V491_05138 [Pseudogymnoascus sp. VKM F-3775]|nr:hypothetical protein V491_05138 [Pseudogymnoascus sp. VKM F-3775]